MAGGRTAISSIAFGAVEGDRSPNAGVRHVCTRMPSERTRGWRLCLVDAFRPFAWEIENIRRGEKCAFGVAGCDEAGEKIGGVYVISYACPM